MEVVTAGQKYKIFKELVVRRLLTKDGKALPSANVVFENINDESGKLISIKAYGGGFGHGVGMSQYGAGFMGSELHIPYEKFLNTTILVLRLVQSLLSYLRIVRRM